VSDGKWVHIVHPPHECPKPTRNEYADKPVDVGSVWECDCGTGWQLVEICDNGYFTWERLYYRDRMEGADFITYDRVI
jgi:hypothetical protein